MQESIIPTPIIPNNINFCEDEQKLDQFLRAYQARLGHQEETKIISFSQELEVLDPLAIFQAINQPNQISFYWENYRQKEALLGYDIGRHFTIEASPTRFFEAQQFIETCLQQLVQINNHDHSFANPHFFCSFSFFACPAQPQLYFPATTIFLPRFQIICHPQKAYLIINQNLEKNSNISLIVQQIKQEIQKIKRSNHQSLQRLPNQNSNNFNVNNLDLLAKQFKSSVASALKSIADQKFSKIVLAQAFDIYSPLDFHLTASLNNLRQRYPDCYVFALNNGKQSNFIGASPERLISIKNQQLQTDALAGSAPRGKTVAEDIYLANQLLKSRKEQREHQAVIDFINQRLTQLNLIPQQAPLRLLQLSGIQHLWTPIYAQLNGKIKPLEVIKLLHPTPAVSGFPTAIACEQIRHYENFERSLYAAPLGWIDTQGNSEFVVGIRSALITNQQARLYSGAGIVAGSDPEQEFAEVQLKLQSLLRTLE